MDWIISANAKLYDHASAFQRWGFIDWHQGNRRYSVGDNIYIYCTRPIMQVMYKTVVERINLQSNQIVDDRAYWHDKEKYTSSQNGKFARLRLVEQVDRPELHFNRLREHGLNGAPQGAFKVTSELKSYMDKYIVDSYFENTFPDSDNTDECIEGAKVSVQVNRYERSSVARKRCIEYHGCSCYVCGMDFEKKYGVLGKGFIHVHHIKPLNEIDETYVVDYKNDLIPVCPNCHAMLHREIDGKKFSWQELKRLVESKES